MDATPSAELLEGRFVDGVEPADVGDGGSAPDEMTAHVEHHFVGASMPSMARRVKRIIREAEHTNPHNL